jgi:monofunctional glycosyltransferase
VDERAQDLEQEPPAGADRCDEPQPRVLELTPTAPPASHQAEPFPSAFASQHILPQAAGGGAGGVVAQVLFAPEPARTEPSNDLPPLPEPEDPSTTARIPSPQQLPSGETTCDPAPPPESPEPQVSSERPAPVDAATEPALIEQIPLAAFGPLPLPDPSSVVAPASPPIDQDRDHDAKFTEQPGQLEESPEAPDTSEPASAYLTPSKPSDETASYPASPLVAREPEVAPPDETTLLDQIPVVQASQPQPAIPPPNPPMLRRIEPDYVPRAESSAQPSPAVVPLAEPELIAPPSPPVAPPLPSREATGTISRRVRLALVAALAIGVVLVGVVLALATVYRWVDPPMSTLMLGQRLAGTPVTQRWVPLERMSPNLSAAVIQSEDGHFCRHHGVDWGELKEAIDSASDGLARGGSTITMQVVKNLFLWPSRSYLRKALEIPIAFVVEALWPKRRILEIYLNIAEWGPGVFGAEAAARYHFRKPALLLTPREAALLAVSLPNPFERQAGRPGPGTQRLADNLLLRMRAASANTACVRAPAKRY